MVNRPKTWIADELAMYLSVIILLGMVIPAIACVLLWNVFPSMNLPTGAGELSQFP